MKEKELRLSGIEALGPEVQDPIKPERRFVMGVVEIPKIKIVERYLVRPLDETHKNNLKRQIKDQGLIEPITCDTDSDGGVVLLAGRHRLKACEELNYTKLPAKVYLGLSEADRLLVGFMSNELRKRPPAGRRFGSLKDWYDETFDKLREDLERLPSEEEVLQKLYYGSTKAKISEVMLGITIDRLKNDVDSLVGQLHLITDAQTPRREIERLIITSKDTKILQLPLLTAGNALFAIKHLCRASPVTYDETQSGNNLREHEYTHLRDFLERIINEMVLPWIEVGEIDATINFFKRHPFEAFTRIVADALVELGCPPQSGMTSPLYHRDRIDWDGLFSRLANLKTAQLWKYEVISKERSIMDLVGRLRYYSAHGRLPPQ